MLSLLREEAAYRVTRKVHLLFERQDHRQTEIRLPDQGGNVAAAWSRRDGRHHSDQYRPDPDVGTSIQRERQGAHHRGRLPRNPHTAKIKRLRSDMQDKPTFSQGVIARTTVLSSKVSLRPVQAWVVEFARCFGMVEADISRIELVVEEAFMSIVHSAFEEDETGEISVVLEHRPGQFVIAIGDHSLPLDLKHLEENEGLALNFLLMKQLLDGFVFINKGKDGKRLELIKNIPAESDVNALREQEVGTAASVVVPAPALEQPLF
ncbi:MAG: ATP-binding protein, partial [Geobacteraceae bacterium]|nr:ATP-binding protein [Geobacteraceae bacterium]